LIDHTMLRPDHRRAIIVALMTSTFMAAIEVTVISTVMPTIVAELGGFELFSWAFGIYLLAQGVMTPIYGRLADLFGRKRTFIVACSLFLVGSALCGLAWSMPSLIAFRALQGLGAGGMAPIASTIMADISAPADRPKAVGYISSIYGIAGILGPLAGAGLVKLGWPLVFWINLPIGALALTLVCLFLHEERPAGRHGVDAPGAALLMLGAGCLMLLLTQHATLPPPMLWLAGLGSVAALAGLVVQQRGAEQPLIPHHFWRNRIIVTGVAFGLTSGAYIIAISGFLPMYVQGVLGGTPLDGGLTLSYVMVSWTVGVLAAGRFVARLPYRSCALIGAGLVLVGSFAPLTLGQDQGPFWIRAGGVLIGTGIGVANLTFTISIQNSVGSGDRGRATSAYFFSRILGQALGAASFGGLLNAGLLRQTAQTLVTGVIGDTADLVEALMDPLRRAALALAERGTLIDILDQALHGVFATAWGLAVAMLALALMLPRKARLLKGS
jgi:MFS family permease